MWLTGKLKRIGLGSPLRSVFRVSQRNTSHLIYTRDVPRYKPKVFAEIVSMHQETPTVKTVWLKVSNVQDNESIVAPSSRPHPLLNAAGDLQTIKYFANDTSSQFHFLPGQWVDLFVPSVPVVGGFSICSSIHTLQEKGLLQLAIKSSQNPSAKWIHNTAQIGDRVSIRAGGEFVYDESKEPELTSQPLLFVAGGVGISPLMGMISEVLRPENAKRRAKLSVPTTLVYSAKKHQDFVFSAELHRLAKENANFRLIMTLTGHDTEWTGMEGRVDHSLLKQTLAIPHSGSVASQTVAFVCGPAGLVSSTRTELERLGVPRTNVRYEKWS